MSREMARGGGRNLQRALGAGRTTLRCAIYTRKSTEEGLEQEFNSLDAQREACAAYILSQRHEGWIPIPEFYDDGGYSGGNMDRPALRQLLSDMQAGKVDVIVVYKVDRLTRSLADFAKIVDVLDAAGASFVSVTQAFNTTTSMGRLTLNVLLSFAQFEREVTSERIRDKIAASKAKGMWMGGPVPLGYRVQDRKLLVCEEEASAVRLIFERYAALGSLTPLEDELRRSGICSKQRSFSNGRVVGGVPFRRGALAHLLQNPVYIGEVRHNGTRYPGEHEPIIDRDHWDRVQQTLESNRCERRLRTRAEHPSLLTGMLFDEQGRPMSPSHAVNGSRRYRYYVSRCEPGADETRKLRIPAGEIEQLVRDRLAGFLGDAGMVGSHVQHAVMGQALHDLSARCRSVSEELGGPSASRQRELLHLLDVEIRLRPEEVAFSLRLDRLADIVGDKEVALEQRNFKVPVQLASRGQELRLMFKPDDRSAPTRVDVKLVNLVAKAHSARSQLVETAGVEAGRAFDVAHMTRLARLSFLAPDIVTAIMEGRQPATLTSRELLRIAGLPMEWRAQREMLRFA